MNETIKNLLERRSVRGYKEDLVPDVYKRQRKN